MKKKNKYEVYIESGNKLIDYDLKKYLKNISRLPVGEIMMNSIDRDGTGQGYFFEALNCIDFKLNLPIIYCGGAGNWKHLYQGLKNAKINAVATANLFNFINDGLINARNILLKKNIKIYKTKIHEGSAKKRCPNINKIKKLGFRSQTKLEEGLIKTIEWYH